jgi:hypothetical protein
MVGEYEDVALHFSRDEVRTSELDCDASHRAMPLGEWRPKWEHPTTEHLLMHLAETAVGQPIDVSYTEDMMKTGTWYACTCRSLKISRFGYPTRSELALRIIIAANNVENQLHPDFGL